MLLLFLRKFMSKKYLLYNIFSTKRHCIFVVLLIDCAIWYLIKFEDEFTEKGASSLLVLMLLFQRIQYILLRFINLLYKKSLEITSVSTAFPHFTCITHCSNNTERYCLCNSSYNRNLN